MHAMVQAQDHPIPALQPDTAHRKSCSVHFNGLGFTIVLAYQA